MAGRRTKRSEIWASGVSNQCIQGTFDRSFWGRLVHFRFSVTLYLENGSLAVKRTP